MKSGETVTIPLLKPFVVTNDTSKISDVQRELPVLVALK